MKRTFNILCSILFIYSISVSQFSEEVLRYSSRGFGLGSRALGMGNAYIGVSDDYSATLWNPAGLGQLKRLEFSLGILNNSKENDITFLGNPDQADVTSTTLNNVSFVFPFPTLKGSLVFAFGYNRNQDFGSVLGFEGYNTMSSIIPSLFDSDIPFYTNLSTLHNFTLIDDSVYQVGDIRESGGSNNWNFSGAVEIEENIFAGFTLKVYNGSYKSEKYFDEYDTRGIYANRPVQDTVKSIVNPNQDSLYLTLFNTFNEFHYQELLNAEVSSAQIIFGLLYQATDELRFGITTHFPTTITVKENYSMDGRSLLDNSVEYADGFDASNEYGITTPWIFGIGASYYVLSSLLVSADIEYTDWTQVAFTDNEGVEAFNLDLQSQFRTVTSYRIGTEFSIPSTDVRIRGGYSLTPSPYKGDPSSFDQVLYTAGVGIFLQRNIAIDATAAFGDYKTFRNHYRPNKNPGSSRTDESISTTSVNVTLSYRF